MGRAEQFADKMWQHVGLLTEAFPLRPDIKQTAPGDSDLSNLREDPRFQELIKS